MKLCEFVYEGGGRERVDVVLATKLSGFTRSKIRILKKMLLVNGKPCKLAYKLKAKDVVYFEYEKKLEPSAYPENIKIDVVFEDENVIVLRKASGLVTHPSPSSPNATLVNALNYYRLYVSNIKDEFSKIIEDCFKDVSAFSKYIEKRHMPPSESDILRLGIVHRLDKDTSGLIITARNLDAQIFLKEEFRKRRVKKFYIAILKGIPLKREALLKTSIFRSKKDGRTFASSTNLKKGRIAISRYKVLKTFGNFSLVKFRIYTGRTHQIRVHAKHIGCPVFADEVYGDKVNSLKLFLHCYKLKINISKGEHKVFKTKIPKRFRDFINKIEKESKNG